MTGRRVLHAAMLCALFAAHGISAAELPIIDAHSNLSHNMDAADVVPLMDEAGISRVILTSRGKRSHHTIAALARAHPGRITASLRAKGGDYARNKPRFFKRVEEQLAIPEFKAMSEVILWHARKLNRKKTFVKAAELVVHPDDRRVRALLEVAVDRGWPFVVHIEFAAAGPDRDTIMSKLEAMLASHRTHPFALAHMGQLRPPQAKRLIETHPNIHFITSHSNPVFVDGSIQPWVNMFDGETLTPEWRRLMVAHPDRFILGFDNVWEKHWRELYRRQTALWRKALLELPGDVAHAVAHGNAERLWKLPPAH